jgi:hypothetical protein
LLAQQYGGGNGLPKRFPTPKSNILEEQLNRDLDYFSSYSSAIADRTPGSFPTNDKTKLLIIGDSQGKDFINILSNLENIGQIQLALLRTRSFCQSVIGVKFAVIKKRIKSSWHERCEKYHNTLNNSRSLAKADIIVFTGSWKLWAANRLQVAAQYIKKINPEVKIYALGPKAQGYTGIDFASRFYMLSEAEQQDRYRPYAIAENNAIESVLAATPNIDNYISLYDILCGKNEREKCHTLTIGGGIIMHDNNHLTPHGAEYFYRELGKIGFWGNFETAGSQSK